MTRRSQIESERRQLELLARRFPDLLPANSVIRSGTPERGEPDFLIERQYGGILGIEHTTLSRPAAAGFYQPRVVEDTVQKICKRARAIYESTGHPRVRVNACIGPGPYQNPELIADYLAGQVAARARPCETVNVSLWPSMGALVELHIAIWDAGQDNDHDGWILNAVGETHPISVEILRTRIEEKNGNAEKYRRHCNELWLLVVSTMFPASSDFVVPSDAQTWQFTHEFDIVCVYFQSENKLLKF